MAERTTGARVYLTIIGLLLILAGGVFVWLMGRSYLRALEVEKWPEVQCAILESGLDERQVGADAPREFRFRVLYAYEWEGETYESERYRLRGSSWSGREHEVAELAEGFPAGSVTTCRVNPERPEIAVLREESKAPGYSIWFPGIFVIGGVGVVVGAWRRKGA